MKATPLKYACKRPPIPARRERPSGTDVETECDCPYCGEPIAISVDQGGGGSQRYIEDCSVCCKPFEVIVSVTDEGEVRADLRRLDG